MLRQEERCPAAEGKAAKAKLIEESNKAIIPEIIVERLVELYLTQSIEDRKIADGKIVAGARKKKGQSEVRRTLYGGAVKHLGTRIAKEITRKDVIDLVKSIVARGANVQAGNVLRELSLAYEFAIDFGGLMILPTLHCLLNQALNKPVSSLPMDVEHAC